MIFAIYYQLNITGKDYTPLFDAIKTIGPWMNYISGMWMVRTSSQTESKVIFDALIPYIDDKDYLFVVELTSNSYGFLPQNAWDWIKANSA